MADDQQEYEYTAGPHPYLREPILYITNLAPHVSETDLSYALEHCVPYRPRIPRDADTEKPLSGTIEFKLLEKAEKALATLQGRPVPGVSPPALIQLSPYPPTHATPLPAPSALPRIVKQLPPDFSDAQLYDLFRPFGPLASVRTHVGFSVGGGSKDTALVEFWREEDAKAAEENLHCAEVGGQNIAVQVYHPPKRTSGSEFSPSPSAPPFIPSGSVAGPYSQQSSPGGYSLHSPRRVSAPFVHGPGQQVQFAPPSGPGSGSHSGLIDPCNLFCKNLDPDIDSNKLFAYFRQYGQIVSARVMRDDSGRSRGFGFVSYQSPDQAALAMHSMNGVVVGSKQIVVRLHEPKQLRQEKLAQRFAGGHNNHPRSRSGATSPTASEAGDSFGWPSPRGSYQGLASPSFSTVADPSAAHERTRRGSGSYYNAALAGQLNIPMTYEDLSTLSTVVRKEVLSGELQRRIKGMDSVPPSDIDAIVDSLVSMSLADVVDVIQDPARLRDKVQNVQVALAKPAAKEPATTTKDGPPPPKSTPSPAASQDSRLLDPNVLNATASAPDHPSTPVSFSTSLSTPPRTSSPATGAPAVPSGAPERERMRAAVAKLEPAPGRAEAITALIMGLSKRERAMCLFSAEVLRAKVADAKMVLESEEEGEGGAEEEEDGGEVGEPRQPVPVTPARRGTAGSILEGSSPQTPDLSSRGPSAAASPTAPVTPPSKSLSTLTSTSTSSGTKESSAKESSAKDSGAKESYTLTTLAALPAGKVLSVLRADAAVGAGLGLAPADALIVRATDELVDGLAALAVPKQKQQIGDKLFRVVKGFGIKGAPKITIHLLDQEELRPLAHLMNSYPAVLKEKALQAQAAIAQNK